MDTDYQYIDLVNLGFDAIEMQSNGASPDAVFEALKQALARVPEIQDCASYHDIMAQSDELDSVGAVEQINEEVKNKGICLVFL